MSVTVVIVNYNSGKLLAECLRHLAAQTVLPARIIVVDNASTDGSAEIADTSATLTVIRMKENIGYAAANNRALAECTGEFVAMLNPDAFPAPQWLERLLEAAAGYPDYALFGSRLVSAENPDLLDGDGDCYHASGLVWRAGHGQRFAQESKTWEIFSPCAAAAMYRARALRRAGGFDEDFFCYLEDVDLGFRLRLLGYRSLQVAGAVARHVGSATTGGQKGAFALYHGHRNLVWTFVKNMPGALFWLLLPFHVLLNLVSVIWFALRGRGKVILRAKRDALSGLPKMWQKRQQIQKNRVGTIAGIWQRLCVLTIKRNS